MGKRIEKVFKKFAEANTASHNTAKWHTDTKGFREHPPSGGSLYYKGPTVLKIILVSFGYPLVHHHTQIHKHIQIYRYLNMHRQFSNQVSILVPPLLSILTWFILLFSHFISFLPHESFVCQQRWHTYLFAQSGLIYTYDHKNKPTFKSLLFVCGSRLRAHTSELCSHMSQSQISISLATLPYYS